MFSFYFVATTLQYIPSIFTTAIDKNKITRETNAILPVYLGITIGIILILIVIIIIVSCVFMRRKTSQHPTVQMETPKGKILLSKFESKTKKYCISCE